MVFFWSTFIFALLTVLHIYNENFAFSKARYKRFEVAFCGYIMLMRVFAATTVILLESTTHESTRRMLHSTHVKVVRQTTSTL